MLKTALKVGIRKLGYELHRCSQLGVNIYRDTHFLLSGKAEVIFDVGANVGQSISAYKELFPEGRIYSFEPDEAAFEEALRIGAQYNDVVVNKIALADYIGQSVFYEYEHSVMSSLLKPGPNCQSAPLRETLVQTTTVEAYCREQEIETIDVLKIDTQGTFDCVLRGAEGMLKDGQIRLVRCELSFKGQYQGHADPLESISWMQDSGYEIVSFYGQHHRDNALTYLDVLYRHRAPRVGANFG
jgi:FkbM family methyltransferase